MTDSVASGCVVHLPAHAFSMEGVKRAAYMLMANLDIVIETTPEGVRCTLNPAKAGSDMATAERDFRREVLDQDLRILVEQRTESYRDAILGLAFSKTGLQDG
ncbi:hypothetical protein OSJ57_18820 [Sphingomonas sp. HH69]